MRFSKNTTRFRSHLRALAVRLTRRRALLFAIVFCLVLVVVLLQLSPLLFGPSLDEVVDQTAAGAPARKAQTKATDTPAQPRADPPTNSASPFPPKQRENDRTLPPPPPAAATGTHSSAVPAGQRPVRAAVAFSLDEADVAEVEWTAAADALPAPVRRAAAGEVHAVQREMLPFVADMLDHALHGYFAHAFPHDALLPLTGGHQDPFSGAGITLLDSLDMLALARRPRTFRRAARWVEEHLALATHNVDTSAFEVNIRAMGGLVAAHYVYEEGVVPVVRGEHDYRGGLVRMAGELGDRLLRVFDSPTGLPYNRVNLLRGEPSRHSRSTTNADAGTYVLEFMALSRLTGRRAYGDAARRAAQVLHDMREPATQLMNQFLDVVSGEWSGQRTSSIGACLDSTLEYAVKYHVLSGEVQEWREFETDRRAASAWLRHGGFYYNLAQAERLRQDAVTQGLSAFYPGTMALGGHHAEAMEGVWATHGLMKRRGTLAEETQLRTGDARAPSYSLRPEHIESIYYLYRATHDPVYLAMGREFAVGLQLNTRVPRGLAVLRSNAAAYSRGSVSDYMESFVIAETLKYLYLLFDEESALHGAVAAAGRPAAGQPLGWVFTTEAHVVPNTWEQWGLDAASARTGLRGGAVGPAYTAYMFGGDAAPLDVEEAALAAEAAAVRDRLGAVRAPGHTAARQREVYRRRRAPWTEVVGAARVRHVEGLLCAARQRLLRGRGSAAGRERARVFLPRMRELATVCAAGGPPLHTPLFTAASPPFARGALANAVHRRYSDTANRGAYDYACDLRHLRGVRRLSKGVYHPAIPLSEY